MKKIIGVIVIILLSTKLLDAAPCYGPNMPQKNQIFAGGQTYAVFKRYLEKDYGEMRSLQHFLLLSYGVTDWFSLDLKGGAGNIKENPADATEIDYPSYMAGGYGFRLRLHENEKSKIVLGFQHISVHPYHVDVEGIKHKSVLDDWQWSLLMSHDLGVATPYVGTRFSRMDYIHWVEDQRKLKKSDRTQSVGLITGVDIPVDEKIWINVEGQFLDSMAGALSINYKF